MITTDNMRQRENFVVVEKECHYIFILLVSGADTT